MGDTADRGRGEDATDATGTEGDERPHPPAVPRGLRTWELLSLGTIGIAVLYLVSLAAFVRTRTNALALLDRLASAPNSVDPETIRDAGHSEVLASLYLVAFVTILVAAYLFWRRSVSREGQRYGRPGSTGWWHWTHAAWPVGVLAAVVLRLVLAPLPSAAADPRQTIAALREGTVHEIWFAGLRSIALLLIITAIGISWYRLRVLVNHNEPVPGQAPPDDPHDYIGRWRRWRRSRHERVYE